MFIHDANNRITIGSFTASLDEFLVLEPSYKLPYGALWQFYAPGSKHLVGYGLYQRNEGAAWTDGDVYLASEDDYWTAHPDTAPNVPGFEAALVAAFGGDFLAINSLYSGWPLFKDALDSAQWSLADLLLTDAYVRNEITTEIYTAIIVAAQANYIPMLLQGRPGVVPLNLIEIVTLLAASPSSTPQADSCAMQVNESSGNVVVIEPISSADSAAIDCTETAEILLPIALLAGDSLSILAETSMQSISVAPQAADSVVMSAGESIFMDEFLMLEDTMAVTADDMTPSTDAA